MDVRPNKQEINEGALTSGVVFKVTEEELVVVLNAPPSGDLDQPLQLELLANEVGLFFRISSLIRSKLSHDD